MKMRVLKQKGYRYGGQRHAKGSIFDAKETHVPVLTAFKIAEAVNEKDPATEAAKAKAAPASKSPATSASKTQASSEKPLAAHTLVELAELAKMLGVDIPRGTKKADILTKIRRSPRYQRRDMRAQ